MHLGPALLCCWPGLPGLWYRGRWSSLALAVAFAVLLNLTVVASFIWTGIFRDDSYPAIAWPALLVIWFTSAVIAKRNLPDVMSLTEDETFLPDGTETGTSVDTLFLEARREYLKGHWNEARSLLLRQLKHYPRDIESRLMLATLYRHTRQFDDAANQLVKLEKFDPAIRWQNEIARERELLRLIQDFESTENDQPAETLHADDDSLQVS